jgi:hypothetical protein
MKRLLFVLGVVFAVVLTNCSKPEDDMTLSSQDNTGIIKSNHPVPFKGSSEGLSVTQMPGGIIQLTSPFPPLVFVHKVYTGTGEVSHFGNSTVTMDFWYVTISLTPGAAANGYLLHHVSGEIIAANGDMVFFEGIADGNTGFPPVFPIPISYSQYDGTYTFDGWQPYPPIPNLYLPTITNVGRTHFLITGGTGRFEGASGNMEGWGVQYLELTYPPNYEYDIPTELSCEGEIQY